MKYLKEPNKSMKIFVYKTLFVFLCIFLIFHFTVGVKLRQIRGEIEKYKSLTFSEEELNSELMRLANAIEVDLDTFKNIFINHRKSNEIT